MSYSTNKLKCHMLFTSRNFVFSDVQQKKIFPFALLSGAYRPVGEYTFSNLLPLSILSRAPNQNFSLKTLILFAKSNSISEISIYIDNFS